MKLVNLTPHAITIHAEAFAGFAARVELPASGAVARCAVTSRSLGTVEHGGVAIPVTTAALGAVTDLPEPSDGIAYAVSRIVAEACPARSDLYFPGEAIRDERGQIVGCRGLCQIGGAVASVSQ